MIVRKVIHDSDEEDDVDDSLPQIQPPDIDGSAINLENPQPYLENPLDPSIGSAGKRKAIWIRISLLILFTRAFE